MQRRYNKIGFLQSPPAIISLFWYILLISITFIPVGVSYKELPTWKRGIVAGVIALYGMFATYIIRCMTNGQCFNSTWIVLIGTMGVPIAVGVLMYLQYFDGASDKEDKDKKDDSKENNSKDSSDEKNKKDNSKENGSKENNSKDSSDKEKNESFVL